MAQTVTPPTGTDFGGAQPTVGTGALGISPDRRAAINLSLSAFLEKELGKQVALALGTGASLNDTALLTRSLKTGLSAKIGASLGIGGGISAGGVGGTAGGGTNLAAGTGASAGIAGGLSGKLGGVAAGGFSLGAGLGTRATTGTGASVALGSSSTGNFGVGAQAGFGGSGASGVKVGAGSSIKTSVLAALDTAMAQQGLSGAERSQIRSDMKPAVSSAVDDSFKSAYGPDLGYPHAQGVQLLGYEVTMQDAGAWHAVFEIDQPTDDSPIATGPFKADIDGVEFVGTVVPDRSGAFAGRQRLYVIGGAGGLDTSLEPKNYASGLTRARTVVDDILRDSGETLSDESDTALLETRLPGWQRSAGTAKHSLDVLCARIGASWRVLRDGTLWIGTDEWPEVEPAGTVMSQDWGHGQIQVAPDNATLVPGIIVRGQKIRQVVHRSGDKGILRTELHAKSPRQLVDNMLERVQRKNIYGYRYRCRVSRRNADGTVDVVTDDERMKGTGVAKCRVLAGMMNAELKPEAGARCLVGWSDGDPSLPYVSEFEAGSPGVTVLAKGTRGAASTGSTVTVLLPALMPFSGTVAGAPATGVLTIVDPGIALIQDGSPDLLL